MKDKDHIKDLFEEKLKHGEAPVNPELWAGISSSVQGISYSTGMSSIAKFGLIAAGVAGLGLGVYLFSSGDEQTTGKPQHSQIQLQEKKAEPQQAEETTSPVSQENEHQKQAQKETGFKENREVSDTKDAEQNFEEQTKLTKEKPNLSVTLNKPPFEVPFPDPNSQDEEKKIEMIEIPEQKATSGQEEKQTSVGQEDQQQEERQQEISYRLEALPNIITPNGDQHNDFLEVNSEGLEEFTVTVLNERGERVYFSEDPNFKWDGRDLSGNPVPNGNYIYYIIAKSKGGENVSKHSLLTITR
ncbi:MAG: hypothetical protein EP338_00795 [Bacteroidetes bacterium]|nr:MAG: hypothetical protein EP338_00795 [Bacteroidota bacterium]